MLVCNVGIYRYLPKIRHNSDIYLHDSSTALVGPGWRRTSDLQVLFALLIRLRCPPPGWDDARRRNPFAPGHFGRELSKKHRGNDRGRKILEEDVLVPSPGSPDDAAPPFHPHDGRPQPHHGPGHRRRPRRPHGRRFPPHTRWAGPAITPAIPTPLPLDRRRCRRGPAQDGRWTPSPGARPPIIGSPPSGGSPAASARRTATVSGRTPPPLPPPR